MNLKYIGSTRMKPTVAERQTRYRYFTPRTTINPQHHVNLQLLNPSEVSHSRHTNSIMSRVKADGGTGKSRLSTRQKCSRWTPGISSSPEGCGEMMRQLWNLSDDSDDEGQYREESIISHALNPVSLLVLMESQQFLRRCHELRTSHRDTCCHLFLAVARRLLQGQAKP